MPLSSDTSRTTPTKTITPQFLQVITLEALAPANSNQKFLLLLQQFLHQNMGHDQGNGRGPNNVNVNGQNYYLTHPKAINHVQQSGPNAVNVNKGSNNMQDQLTMPAASAQLLEMPHQECLTNI